ncbi:MAG TPA: nitroreductase family protein [Candidatus Cloacimonadota bacterium]|nr:nitroreductase family protein [Candidatus Cloacimonadota bacterium]HPM02479.1 nitroreductase family protein [Candidatus Cloacimonadota bacterium]
MSGIIFFKTKSLEKVSDFYIHQLDMRLWLKQVNCNILQSDQLLIGFLEAEQAETEGIITFFFKTKEEVDYYYEKLKHISVNAPLMNDKYQIYHFYAKDPEGRKIEFQCFIHHLRPWLSGKCLLRKRRSIRQFTSEPVEKELLEKVFNLCKYAPTSRNSQSFYFVVISNPEQRDEIARIREGASAPIAKAPLAVAVVADSKKTKRLEQDACIAASYLLLSAHLYGLGTCWITDMNRDEIKSMLDIPQDDYIACVTPIGYPKEFPEIPTRRSTDEFVFWK